MASRIVFGLFESEGIAEDARNRLKTEGVPESELHLKVLSKIGPVPSTMAPELDASFVNSFILGNFRDSFSRYIRNGETIVCVQALADERMELAVDTLRQYTPLAVGVASVSEDGATVSIEHR
jgi:hypothetical protein